MDPCLGGQAAQDRKMEENLVQRAVQISLRVTGNIQKTVERWYGDK